MLTFIITGAAGFIGSAVCRHLRANKLARVVALDAMTYAASREAWASLENDPDFSFTEADITTPLDAFFAATRPDAVIHLAAETHVDRSIDQPGAFLNANVFGTFSLLETTRRYLASLPSSRREAFRFLHVSTDEVYGALGAQGLFTETSPYTPSSPYAASKAASDHLALSWHKTYGLPVIVSNGANTYGPFQFPEKLIPLCLTKALRGEPLPLYGNGTNVRDWLYVEDHARALCALVERGRVGEKYNIGGGEERSNIALVRALCALLDEKRPQAACLPHEKLITFVADRPGHDARYAMDCQKARFETNWEPVIRLDEGLRLTVDWYLDNQAWCESIRTRRYAGERLGHIRSDKAA